MYKCIDMHPYTYVYLNQDFALGKYRQLVVKVPILYWRFEKSRSIWKKIFSNSLNPSIQILIKNYISGVSHHVGEGVGGLEECYVMPSQAVLYPPIKKIVLP